MILVLKKKIKINLPLEEIQQMEAEVEVYTDASKLDGRIGIGIFCGHPNFQRTWLGRSRKKYR
jgi:hypothetical protein